MVGTDFIIKNINDSDIEDAKKFFLKFSYVNVIESTKYGDILTQINQHWAYIINDVLVAQEENFLFSSILQFWLPL